MSPYFAPNVLPSLDPGPSIRPEVVTFLIQKVARIDAMLNAISVQIDLKNHTARTAQADAMAQTETKKLYGN